MFYRISCVAIVIFWLVMTVLLVNRSYFMSEDRLPLVKDPSQVVERFLTNPNPTDLNVYRSGALVGSITIVPHAKSDGSVELLITALGKIDLPGLARQDVAWRGVLGLTREQEVTKANLQVKFRDPYIVVGLEIDPETFEIGYKVEQDGELLMDSDDKSSTAVKRVKFLLGAWGLSPKALKRKHERGESLARKDSMVARFGKVVIAGERQTAYIIHMAPTSGPRFKFYFSEAGEILKIGPMLDYEILSEGFMLMSGSEMEEAGQ